jgi:Fur family transcriptional regulator, zinc uptake regulator
MANKRRAAGELDGLIVALLACEERPLTGLMLTGMLREQGETVTLSLVFRALCKLVEHGIVHKLLTSRGYVLVRSRNEIYLSCTVCGAVGRVVSEATFRRLDAAAERSGFRATRPIVEMVVQCSRCSNRGSEEPAVRGVTRTERPKRAPSNCRMTSVTRST